MEKLVLEPVTRIEGHAKITVQLDEEGNVKDTRFHVMEFRGFEKFLQGRRIEEAPRIVPRICGICQVQHHLASAKAVDACFGFEPEDIPETAYKMREIMNWASYVHSHGLHFYFLAAPDFIGGKDRETRNIFKIIQDSPDVAKQAIELRKNAQDIVAATGGRAIHPVSFIPGGITTELDKETQEKLLKKAKRNVEIAESTLELAIPIFEDNMDLVESLGTIETYHMGLVKNGTWDVYDGVVRVKDKNGENFAEFGPDEYTKYIAEHVKPYSWLKFPYLKELGYPDGVYRVSPLSRLNVADKMPDAAPKAQEYFKEFRNKFGYAQQPLLYHWARLIEMLAAAECMASALEEDLSGKKIHGKLERQEGEGVGIVEAPRGTLIHHYACDKNGIITKANLIVATVQNNPAMEMGIQKVAKEHIKPGVDVDDKIYNLMEMVIRAYDPCLSCATHTVDGKVKLFTLEVLDSEGNVVKRL